MATAIRTVGLSGCNRIHVVTERWYRILFVVTVSALRASYVQLCEENCRRRDREASHDETR